MDNWDGSPVDSAETEDRIKTLSATRRGKLGVCTRKLNEIKTLLVPGGNVGKVNDEVVSFKRSLDEFNEYQGLVQNILTTEMKVEDRTQWYEPKMDVFNDFLKEVEIWKNEQQAQLTVGPLDSISNVSKRSKAKSTKSGTSSVTAARLRAEAEKAALLIRASTLKEKQALEMEQAKMQARLEQMELDISLAESDARLKILADLESTSQPPQPELLTLKQPPPPPHQLPKSKPQMLPSQFKSQHDVMNEYLESQMQNPNANVSVDPEPISINPLGARQKTTSQGISNRGPRPSEPTATHITQQQPIEMGTGITASNNDDKFLTVIQRQNEIADLLVLQQKLTSLPSKEIPVFDGNPLNYQAFMRAFEHGIEEKTKSHQDRIYYLEQYTSGPCRELVRSCLHMDANRGYLQAKTLLKRHFGDDTKIASAYMEKALNWNSIKVEDGNALHCYALFLRGCCNAMRDLDDIEELDLTSNLKLIVSKLPYKLREKWRATACDILEQTQRRARLTNLVLFMEKQARILNDPLFGDIHDPLANVKISKPRTATESKSSRFTSKGSSFATTVTTVSDSKAEKSPVKSNMPFAVYDFSCLFCSGKHPLPECPKMNAQAHEAKVQFLREKGLCFGCLKVGHLSRNCKRRLTCQTCQARHPTILHINRSKPEMVKSNNVVRPEETSSVTSALVSLGEGEGTGAGKDCILAIVPVQVKLCNGSKSVLAYAFLDPGSTDTFCTEKLMRQLNAKGRRTEVLLQTMGTEKTVKSYELNGLEVGNMEGDTYLTLPKLYTQNKIPVTKRNILTQLDLDKWSYLQEIKVKEIDADVELLIGVNTPKAMEPWKIINSQENGPYAVKTLLGWVVNGPLHASTAMDKERPRALVNRISIVHLENLLKEQYAHDFPEKEYDEKREMSVDDRKFAQIASSSVALKDGHYHLPLPLRDRNTVMPNNYQMAEQRALYLKRKFKKDDVYATEYKRFMSDIIMKGYAEKVPSEDLHQENGKLWYIPHHGVYHKRKKTIRVVFDCASSYKGASLNKVLLQGPDLANSLIGVLLRFRQ